MTSSSVILLLGLASSVATDTSTVSFSRDIRPILADRCFACHGPDAETREAELRLDQATGPEGSHASAIQPGSPSDSELWHRITSDDEDVRMPPPSAHTLPLTEEEQQLIRRWIESGAKYEGFWAFLPPQKPALPTVENAAWSDQPIDLFVLRKLESVGLQPAEEADLRRRVQLGQTQKTTDDQ